MTKSANKESLQQMLEEHPNVLGNLDRSSLI